MTRLLGVLLLWTLWIMNPVSGQETESWPSLEEGE